MAPGGLLETFKFMKEGAARMTEYKKKLNMTSNFGLEMPEKASIFSYGNDWNFLAG